MDPGYRLGPEALSTASRGFHRFIVSIWQNAPWPWRSRPPSARERVIALRSVTGSGPDRSGGDPAGPRGRPADRGGLLERVGEGDQLRLAPPLADEADPDRQPGHVSSRDADGRPAGDRGW